MSGEREVQVGWLGPYGIVPGGMDVDPAPHWHPVYVKVPEPARCPTCDSHEALRARLAEVKAERDAAERAFTAQTDSVGNWQRRAEAAEARLAEVEAERDRALRRTQAERTANEAIRVLEEERDGAIAGQVMLDDKLTLMEHRAIDAERRLAEVEQALRPFAEYAEGLDDALPDSVAVAARSHTGPGFDRHEQVSFGDFRRARAVLDKGEPDG